MSRKPRSRATRAAGAGAAHRAGPRSAGNAKADAQTRAAHQVLPKTGAGNTAAVRGRADSSARARAARNLKAILSGRRTTDWATGTPNQSSLSLELTYGCLRHYFALAEQINTLLAKPLRDQDQDLYGLLLVGAYQLQHTRIPPHAALNETVSATEQLRKAWAKGLINAVLRKLPGDPPAAATNHPDWLRQRLNDEYGADAGALMAANNSRGPLCLRINTSKIAPADYRRRLDAEGIGYARSWPENALILNAPQPAASLPGFNAGWVAVQDIAAQLALRPLLDRAAPGQRLLDACAAPGGKLFGLIEARTGLAITAIDNAPKRLDTLREIAHRLGHEQFDCLAADAGSLDWWDGKPFDLVLLDAPCSGTGTLRRHPEIKVLRGPADIRRSARKQAALLTNLWYSLRPGGTLLYCTCSILSEENDQVVAAFLSKRSDAHAGAIGLPTGRATRHGWQLLPLDPATDGLYVAAIEKRR